MPVVAILLGVLVAALLMSIEAVSGFLRLGKAYGWLFELSLGGLLGYLVYALARVQTRLRALESGQGVATPPVPASAPAAVPPPAKPAPAVTTPVAVATPAPARTVAAPAVVASEPPRWWAATREFLFGGNTAVRIGVIVLFFGVAFLLKYAADRNLFPIELRLASAALGGLVLLVFGWRLRARLPGYALALQGGAVGIFYLTVFMALRRYHLLSPEFAFAMLALVGVFSAMLAVLQNARSLAVLGAAGGFLAPILASTGAGQHVILFSYYALLNAGIFAIAWFRAWRSLNLLGFAFTFVIGMLWGNKYYRPELFDSTEPFLILFTLMYIGVAVLYALRQPLKLSGLVDGTLVFGVPIVGFAIQAVLVQPYEFGLAWSALALGAVYIALASLLWRRLAEQARLLTESFLALGVGFATLAVPLAFDGRWTAAAWALEGAALLWVGVRQQRLLARLAGAALVLLSGFFYLHDVITSDPYTVLLPVLNARYLGAALIAAAALFGAWTLDRHRERLGSVDTVFAVILFIWGLLWWLSSGNEEIARHLTRAPSAAANVGFVALSVVLLELLGRRFRWTMASRVAPWGIAALFPLLIGFALMWVNHPLAAYGYLAWPIAFAAHFWSLRRAEIDGRKGIGVAHAIGWWWLALIAVMELHWQVDHWVAGAGTWSEIAWALIPTVLVLWAGSGRAQRWWPWRTQPAYLVLGSAPLAGVLAWWCLIASFTLRGSAWPLPYVPLLNPLDLALAFAMVAMGSWLWRLDRERRLADGARRPLQVVLAALAFLWLNSALVRAFHHLAGVPFDTGAILHSQLVQAGFSVFWSLLSLATMVLATRRGWRAIWITGAALLGVVVVKLFLVDLEKTATLARVVSFLSVGVLLLIVGYLSPVPPRRAKEEK